MPDPFPRRLAFLILALVVIGGALRLWAWIAFPALDSYDRTPLIGAAVGCAIGVACALPFVARGPAPIRFVAVVIGTVVGVSLGFGVFMVANGLFDRTPTRWLPYTVAGHWHGRRSIVALARTGTNGPPTLWLPEDRATVGVPIGTPVTVPMRPGVFHLAWRPEAVRIATHAD